MLLAGLTLRKAHPITPEGWRAQPLKEGGVVYGRESWVAVMVLLISMEVGCVGLWAATGAAELLLAALAAGLGIVYLGMFSGR
jgi:hypothetical protein